MRLFPWILLFVFVMHSSVARAQLLSRFLNRFLFRSRHSVEDDFPRYSRRRPPPRRRYNRRPSDSSDPFKYDPDDEDYHKEHSLPRPPRRSMPSHKASFQYRLPPQTEQKFGEQDRDDTNPPMTIYLQPGSNGEKTKPGRIRVVTLDSPQPPPTPPPPHREPDLYGHSPYRTGAPWSRQFVHRDIILAQNDLGKRRLVYVDYAGAHRDYPGSGLSSGHAIGLAGPLRPVEVYGSTKDATAHSGGAVIFPDAAYSMPGRYESPAEATASNSLDEGVQSHTTTAAKMDYDYYRRKRKK